MKILITLFSVITLIFVIGCGSAEMANNNKKSELSDLNPPTPTSDFVKIYGHISPINISVDGSNYSDSEDFYTQEIDRLEKLIKEQYPKYELHFDAEVGLRDFKQGLSAYLVSMGDTGVADETIVDGRGQFSFSLPSTSDLTQTYILRAYKRIGLRLEYKNDIISWCYNFYAEKKVIIEKDKSLVLREFTTKVTKYQCNVDKNTGISLPSNESSFKGVKEAFEDAEIWPGYGPYPKAKNAAKEQINDPSEISDKAEASSEEISEENSVDITTEEKSVKKD